MRPNWPLLAILAQKAYFALSLSLSLSLSLCVFCSEVLLLLDFIENMWTPKCLFYIWI